MIEIAIAATDLGALNAALLSADYEQCAVLFASETTQSDGRTRLLIRDIDFPRNDDYAEQSTISAVLRPLYVAQVTKRARRENLSLIFAHSHPGDLPPHFSTADDDGERHLAAFLDHHLATKTHAALVISRGGLRARRLGAVEGIKVVALGLVRSTMFDPERLSLQIEPAFDRQVRAFGVEGQRELAGLRVAIVGLGGTGSLIAQQLVHLGVRTFILIDPDTLEVTNLNRVVGATPADVGLPKVEVAKRTILGVAPGAVIAALRADLTQARTALRLTDADIILGCTDSHGSRSVLQQVSYQYLIPCVDMGSTITTVDGSVTGIHGRAQLLSPGLACFSCSGLLNSEEVRRDMMTAFERKRDPYVHGAHEPAPAVISLNSTVASLAITMLLAFTVGVPSPARYVLYNAMTSSVRPVRATPQEDCFICSRRGTLARGDAVRLFARQD
jgi:molybdopterin/thiamine biosynthesis adenylyltransferase